MSLFCAVLLILLAGATCFSGLERLDGLLGDQPGESPIDIQTASSLDLGVGSGLCFFNHEAPQLWNITNNGYDFGLRRLGGPWPVPMVTAPFLSAPYTLSNIHFHTTALGGSSEHAIDGKKYRGEMHAVYVNSRYSPEELATKKDAIFVIALFIDESFQWVDRGMEWTLHEAGQVQEASSQALIVSSLPTAWVAPLQRLPFAFLYRGSSTTPPYKKNFLFYVVPHPLYVTPNALFVLRSLRGKSGEVIDSSVREVQPSGNRPVIMFRNTPGGSLCLDPLDCQSVGGGHYYPLSTCHWF